MPINNQFRHQPYPTTPVQPPVVRALSVEPDERRNFTELHTRHGFQRVLLVHGTFMGSDPFGIQAMLSGLLERRASLAVRLALQPVVERLADQTKRVTDALTGDVANYNEAFRADFQELCGGDPTVELLTPTWSSSNTHLARAELAARLVLWLSQLEEQGLQPGQDRVLLWGHSHAGNGFALLSNLLGGSRESVATFFEATGGALGDVGRMAQQALDSAESPHPWARSLDMVTFGTPVRYGWECRGYRSLIHIIHHHVIDEEHPGQALPAVTIGCQEMSAAQINKALMDVLGTRHGDWVQTFAIAGTDLPAVGNQDQNLRMQDLLETGLAEATPPDLRNRFAVNCSRWSTATRTHTDGVNLLIEFEKRGLTRFGRTHKAVLGHGVYTVRIWLPALLTLVLDTLEQNPDAPE